MICLRGKMKKSLEMNIALLTSNHLRHKYIASEIANKMPLKIIICEDKNPVIQDVSNYNEADSVLMTEHFKERELSEFEFFGDNVDFPKDSLVYQIEYGKINSQDSLDILVDNEIDCVLLFGSSIIKPIITDEFPNKVINLHLGLSPYYKGSGTNFFPIVNNEFECLGATIHLAIDKVDAGEILHQIRIDDFDENDTIHSIGNKIIKKSGEVYPIIVNQYLSDKIEPKPQVNTEEIKEYKIKDFTPQSLLKAKEVLLNAGIKKYSQKKQELLKLKPIVTNYYE